MKRQFKNRVRDRLGNHLESRRWATLIEVILIFGIVLMFIRIVTPFFQGNQILQQGFVGLANIILIALVYFGQWLRRLNFRDLGLVVPVWNWRTYLKIILWSSLLFVIALFSFVLGSVVMTLLAGTTAQPDVDSYQYVKENPWIFIITLLGVYLVSSFGEELVYRGFLIQRISSVLEDVKFGKTYSVLISALIFGLAHYTWGVTGMVQTGFMGLVLGTFYIRFTKALIILILAHMFMDTLLLASIYLA